MEGQGRNWEAKKGNVRERKGLGGVEGRGRELEGVGGRGREWERVRGRGREWEGEEGCGSVIYMSCNRLSFAKHISVLIDF